MKSAAPIVFVFVLSFAFLLLLLSFRSIVIPIKAIVMNLLSVGAAYGLLVAIAEPEPATTGGEAARERLVLADCRYRRMACSAASGAWWSCLRRSAALATSTGGVPAARSCQTSAIVEAAADLTDMNVNQNAWISSMLLYKLGLFGLELVDAGGGQPVEHIDMVLDAFGAGVLAGAAVALLVLGYLLIYLLVFIPRGTVG